MLGDSDVVRTEDHGLIQDVVSRIDKRVVYHFPGVAAIVACEVADVLQKCVLRLVVSEDTENVEE